MNLNDKLKQSGIKLSAVWRALGFAIVNDSNPARWQFARIMTLPITEREATVTSTMLKESAIVSPAATGLTRCRS